MNMLSPPRVRLTVEIILDLVCPWCFLGTRRLARTLSLYPGVGFDLGWRPFLLNPDMPAQGVPRADYLARKFGSAERAERLQQNIETLGRAEGIEFHFERITRTPSTIDAHRLVALAAGFGLGQTMVDWLFTAHFCAGEDIGDRTVLDDLAQTLGIPAAARQALWASPHGLEQIHNENLRAHRLGVNGVPCFILGQRHAIAGAQDIEAFQRLIDVALVEGSSEDQASF